LLFGGSIRENIAYGRPGATENEILAASQRANCHEFVERFPDGYETVVGERGVQLSGGQKQRVALARALLYGGEVLLLDDPFSNVDAETEEKLLETVRAAARERFVLLITHRIKTLQAADRIVVMNDGRIVAEGTHQSLLAQSGLYRELHERQCWRERLM
jgi:ABC-type multidrug transport system fused ATPase/permease subunit